MNEHETNELQNKIDLLEAKLEYYHSITEKYFKNPKEKYGLVNLEDGSILNANEIQKEINTLRSYHAQMAKKNNIMLLEEEKTSINIKSKKHERRFLKMYYVSLRNLTKDLDVTTLGMLQKFIQYIRTDGTNGLIGSNAKADWYAIIGLNKVAFYKHFEILENLNVIKFVKNKGIYINPYYARYGNELEKETLELFKIDIKNGELCLTSEVKNVRQKD